MLEVISAFHLDANSVTLEISEQDAIEPWAGEQWRDAPDTYFHNRLAAIAREVGVTFAVDDFGAGYASVSRMAELPVTQIKVDRAILHHRQALQELDLVVAVARDAIERGETHAARAAIVEGVDGSTRDFLYGRGPLFDERVAAGHIVDGHADLLADDIFCLADGPRVLDCMEVDDLSFDVQPGTITGFVGPNGAGKTTTLRVLLGLVRPTAGAPLVNGVRYASLDRPTHHVGAVLEASGFHPGRTARDHLHVLALATGIPAARVDAVLEEVDLAAASRRRVGSYSLGMRQRRGLAAALLGDPGILVLDEPTNGLDPAGVHWLRTFLRSRVDGGRTALVSSHLLAELALSADSVVIVKGGRLVTQGPVAELTGGGATVRVRTPQAEQLRVALVARGVVAVLDAPDHVVAHDVGTEVVGQAVAEAGIVVYEMSAHRPALEDAFLAFTTDEGTTS